tara:strand:+ start:1307 stop:1480 length:174 start_codon:yes stop_codon:yes gene_type:complete
MYELEIMVTGYTVIVIGATAAISRCITRKKFKKLYDEIYELEKEVLQLKRINKSSLN